MAIYSGLGNFVRKNPQNDKISIARRKKKPTVG